MQPLRKPTKRAKYEARLLEKLIDILDHVMKRNPVGEKCVAHWQKPSVAERLKVEQNPVQQRGSPSHYADRERALVQ
jgi:hypothetical protein